MIEIGVVLMVLGGIGLLVAAFRESWVWGLGCLLCPLVFVPFLILHGARAWFPLVLSVLGVGMIVLFGQGLA